MTGLRLILIKVRVFGSLQAKKFKQTQTRKIKVRVEAGRII